MSMVLPALAQGAAKVGQGATKIGRQTIKAGSQSSSRLTRFRQATNQAKKNREAVSKISPPSQNEIARRSNLQSNQLQSRMNSPAPSTKNPTPNEEQTETEENQSQEEENEDDEEQEEAQKTSFQSMMQMIKIQGALSEAMGIKQQQVSATGTSKAELKIKHKATDMAVNTICSFDPTFCILRLLWMNIKMIYGSWIKKGKDAIIPPLSWDPIPMPVDKSAILLQGLVIVADIAVIAIILMIIGFFLIIIKQIMDVVNAVK